VAGCSAVLSTYGLSAADLTALREAWDGWWNGEFEPATLPGEATAG